MTELYAVPQHQSSFADLAKELWSYLTDRGAAVNYEFVDMTVEVPRETGAESCTAKRQAAPKTKRTADTVTLFSQCFV